MKGPSALATLSVTLAIACAVLAISSPSEASFPGINGDILFDSSRDGDTAIWRMDADTTDQVKIADSSGIDWGGAWSPDGTKIAFTSERDGSREIYVMNADGSNQQRLTNNNQQDFEPAWSPDNETIIYRSSAAGGDLWTVTVQGGPPVPLANLPGDVSEPQFSPDGSKIVFKYVLDQIYTLYTINANGTGLEKLTTADVSEDDPNWSPDGEKIAFVRSVGTGVSGLGGQTDLFVIDADGTNETNLTSDPAVYESDPQWSPDGSTILYVSNHDNGTDGLYLMNPDGTDVRLLLADAYSPGWQPVAEGSLLWGDADCSGTVDPVDALKTLRKDSGLTVVSEPGCPDIGAAVQVLGVARVWGDPDCSGAADPIDALKLLRHDAGLSVARAEGCPYIEDYFVVTAA